MNLHHKILSARQHNGLTQEELADLAGLSVRTIQRIEAGETLPRSYTIKAIAKALGQRYEDLVAVADEEPVAPPAGSFLRDKHFLRLFNLSCFSYLIIPWVHFMLPNYLLKKENGLQEKTIELGRGMIRQQVYWTVSFHALLLLTLAYNLVQVMMLDNRSAHISYFWPCAAMYLMNAILIMKNASRIHRQLSK